MKETMEARLGWLESLMEDGEAPISEKVDTLLTVLGEVRSEREVETAGDQAAIATHQKIIASMAAPYNEAEEHIKAEMWRILEEFYPDERHDSEAGRAQIVRPKKRVSYDTKGLETLRLSFKDVDQMIGHLRKETATKPYLKVKLK